MGFNRKASILRWWRLHQENGNPAATAERNGLDFEEAGTRFMAIGMIR